MLSRKQLQKQQHDLFTAMAVAASTFGIRDTEFQDYSAVVAEAPSRHVGTALCCIVFATCVSWNLFFRTWEHTRCQNLQVDACPNPQCRKQCIAQKAAAKAALGTIITKNACKEAAAPSALHLGTCHVSGSAC
jgi:hypothetical protein